MDQQSLQQLPAQPRIGLCLSGGGFRATFFHLGVVKLLKDAGLLSKVVDICSVSGGSILAANLALTWQTYVRQGDETFFRAADPLVQLGLEDLRGRIFRRWLMLGFLPWFGRTRMLEAHYASLFKNKELSSLPVSGPRFHFLATSLNTGMPVAFSRVGYHDGRSLHRADDLPLGLAVAASSAFPPLFPPIEIDSTRLGMDAQQFPLGKEQLTDGGVFDNPGICSMLRVIQEARTEAPNLVLVSNASSPFRWSGGNRFSAFMPLGVRSTEILMARVAELDSRSNQPPVLTIELPISDLVASADLSGLSLLSEDDFLVQDERVQKLLSHIRTDLDEFSREEICSLIRHGYEVALKHLLRSGLLNQDFAARDPIGIVFPFIGWPAASRVDLYLKLASLFTVQRKLRKLRDMFRAFAEPPADLDQAKEPSSVEIQVLRKHLECSSRRGYRLWNAGDGFCWLVVCAIVILSSLLGSWAFVN